MAEQKAGTLLQRRTETDPEVLNLLLLPESPALLEAPHEPDVFNLAHVLVCSGALNTTCLIYICTYFIEPSPLPFVSGDATDCNLLPFPHFTPSSRPSVEAHEQRS